MNRFERMFVSLKRKGEAAFIPFIVLGDPNYSTSFKIVKRLIDSKADALELGFAFSDPIADGKTIQEAAQRALAKGINTDKCFALIKRIRSYDEGIPVSLLVYYNIVLQRGIKRFYREAKKAGVDAVLAADCPVEEAGQLLKAARQHGIAQVFIVAPTTTKRRLQKIARHASGYIYAVSLLGVTGARKSLERQAIELIKRLKRVTKLPVCVGFGISKPNHVSALVKAGADGCIVGSAIIDLIKRNISSEKRMLESVGAFAVALKRATRLGNAEKNN